MIYDELLIFLASNYLSRENAFDLLNNAVLDLAGQNATHFGWMVGGFVALFAVLVAITLLTVNFLYRKDKRELEKTKIRLESAITKSDENNKNAIKDFHARSRKEIEEFEKNAIRAIDKQEVVVRFYFWNTFYMTKTPDSVAMVISLNHYIEKEYWYFQTHSEFVNDEGDFEFIKHQYELLFEKFKQFNLSYSQIHHDILEKILIVFSEIQQFSEAAKKIIETSKNMIQNPPLPTADNKSKSS